MISKYVLAGPPCSGKTKGIEFLRKSLSAKGYKVYIVQETASELIKSGMDRQAPEFPYYNFALMTYKEFLFEKMAKDKKEDAIILCDRGRMDAKAYRGPRIFEDILKRFNIASEEEVLNSYDGVIFLQSTADGLEKEYLTNEIRIESLEQVRKMQKLLMNVWQAHSKFVFIPNSEHFSEKLEKIESAILQLTNDKLNKGISVAELISYANELDISNEEMIRVIEEVLHDKKIIDRKSYFEH